MCRGLFLSRDHVRNNATRRGIKGPAEENPLSLSQKRPPSEVVSENLQKTFHNDAILNFKLKLQHQSSTCSSERAQNLKSKNALQKVLTQVCSNP